MQDSYSSPALRLASDYSLACYQKNTINSLQPMPKKLSIVGLKKEARSFAAMESIYSEPKIYGVTDENALITFYEISV